jgi:hypothetical protein
MPNNCPPILHSSRGAWEPLFPKRGTARVEDIFPSESNGVTADRARELLAIAATRRKLRDGGGELWIQAMLVLKALELKARTIPAISAKTRIPLKDVKTILGFVQIAGWATDKYRLTVLGRLELKRLRRRRKASPVLPSDDVPFYYPTQLRVR